MSVLEEALTPICIGGVVFLLVYVITRKRESPGNPPPGPSGIPFYGNALELKKWDKKGPGLLDKWAKEYGPIYKVRLGVHDVVILNDQDTIREVLLKHADKTSGRSTNVFLLKIMGLTNVGLIMNENESWKETRRTVLHSLRDFGMGKKSLESRIQEEARALVDHLDTLADKALDPRIPLHNAFSNVIISIVFGERYEYDDPEFSHLSEKFQAFFKDGGFKPELFTPYLLPIMPITNPGFLEALKAHFSIRKTLKRKIQQHRDQFNPDDICSFIDIYLKAEMDGQFSNTDTEKTLFMTIMDLFTAGSETSSTTLRWMILYLIHNTHVQRKCQQAIANEIGTEKPVALSDKCKVPYVEATMLELQRIANIAPYGVMHRAEADIETCGYTIARDTLILANLHALHNDTRYWNNPDTFDPDRWLDSDGNIVTHESYLPFGIGPRACMGKNLALQSMFIVLVTLLQRFSFTPADPDNPPPIAGKVGIVHTANDFLVKLERI